ncbi:MAG: hypothetical protein J7M25_11100 [Deltaproteobacteria bacterium]|nr:hypothetical protein [Deltaproteobacteria bacterium]
MNNPYGQQQNSGLPPAPNHANQMNARYGRAQKALAGAGAQMKILRFGLLGGGGVAIVVGIVLLVLGNISAALSLLIAGVVMVAVALFVLPQFSGMLGQATATVNALAQKNQLALTGIPAQGRLMQVQQTGRMVNDNPEIQALVEVHHPTMGVYQAQTNVVVPQIAIPQFQPDAHVQVRINPNVPQDIAVVV